MAPSAHPTGPPVALYEERIRALIAESEAEGSFFHPVSLAAFKGFVSQYPSMARGSLGLLENGNFRAVWKGERGTHLGLQFLPDGRIQYVIFKRRPDSDAILRVRGRDTPDGIRRRMEAFDLHNLLACEPAAMIRMPAPIG